MSTTEWVPANEAEAALLEAFGALGETPGTGYVQGETEEEKQFILSTKGYYGTFDMSSSFLMRVPCLHVAIPPRQSTYATC